MGRGFTALPRPSAEMDEIVEGSLRRAGAVGRGEGPAARAGHRPVRRPAAAPVHRPRHRREPGGDPDGRALLGAGPDRHRAHRGADRRAEGRTITIVIVTHSMQQAARVSQRTAFFHLGELIEYGRHGTNLHQPAGQADRGLHHRPVRLSGGPTMADMAMPIGKEHIVKSFDEELKRLRQAIAQMGGLVEEQLQKAVDALVRRDSMAASQVIADDKKIDELEEQVSNLVIRLLALRQPMANDLRHIVSALKISSDLERIGDYAKNVSKRAIGADAVPASEAGLCDPAHGQAGAGDDQGNSRRLYPAGCGQGGRGLAAGRGGGRDVHQPVPRAADLHDGGSAQHHAVDPSAVHRQEHRAHGRSRHQRGRGYPLPGAGAADRQRPAESRHDQHRAGPGRGAKRAERRRHESHWSWSSRTKRRW